MSVRKDSYGCASEFWFECGSEIRIPHPAFRIPLPAFRIPLSASRIPHSASFTGTINEINGTKRTGNTGTKRTEMLKEQKKAESMVRFSFSNKNSSMNYFSGKYSNF